MPTLSWTSDDSAGPWHRAVGNSVTLCGRPRGYFLRSYERVPDNACPACMQGLPSKLRDQSSLNSLRAQRELLMQRAQPYPYAALRGLVGYARAANRLLDAPVCTPMRWRTVAAQHDLIVENITAALDELRTAVDEFRHWHAQRDLLEESIAAAEKEEVAQP